MRKLFLLGLALSILGCEQPDPISSAQKKDPETAKTGTLVTATVDLPFDSLITNEPLQLIPKLIIQGEIDTTQLKFNWTVTANGVPVDLRGLTKEKLLSWIPTLPGKYTAHVTITYGEKTVEIYVLLIITGGVDHGSHLAQIRKGMNGSWVGMVTTPWVQPYPVAVEFREDGTYSARNLETGNGQPALYYGTDEDSPFKTFLLDSVKSNGDATGEITVYFDVGTSVADEMRHVRLGPGGRTLSLEMWHFGSYGPVRLDLTRMP